MEHAAHGAHGGKLGTYVGLTIACLGVLLALAAAMVGGERTELIATMVERTNVAMKYQALSTKYRVLLAQLRQLHSLEPDAAKFRSWDDESKKLAGTVASADEARIARIVRLENAKNLDAEIPTREDMLSFVALVKDVGREQEAANEWSESYEFAVKAHALAAERFEWAQLAAEIGVVIASLALLFSSRPGWYVSLSLIAAALLILATTYVNTAVKLHTAEETIHEAQQRFEAASNQKSGEAADEELISAVEKDEPPVIDPH
jgi:hypothetical protein